MRRRHPLAILALVLATIGAVPSILFPWHPSSTASRGIPSNETYDRHVLHDLVHSIYNTTLELLARSAVETDVVRFAMATESCQLSHSDFFLWR